MIWDDNAKVPLRYVQSRQPTIINGNDRNGTNINPFIKTWGTWIISMSMVSKSCCGHTICKVEWTDSIICCIHNVAPKLGIGFGYDELKILHNFFFVFFRIIIFVFSFLIPICCIVPMLMYQIQLLPSPVDLLPTPITLVIVSLSCEVKRPVDDSQSIFEYFDSTIVL